MSARSRAATSSVGKRISAEAVELGRDLFEIEQAGREQQHEGRAGRLLAPDAELARKHAVGLGDLAVVIEVAAGGGVAQLEGRRRRGIELEAGRLELDQQLRRVHYAERDEHRVARVDERAAGEGEEAGRPHAEPGEPLAGAAGRVLEVQTP